MLGGNNGHKDKVSDPIVRPCIAALSNKAVTLHGQTMTAGLNLGLANSASKATAFVDSLVAASISANGIFCCTPEVDAWPGDCMFLGIF